MSGQGIFVTTNASGAREGARMGHVVVIVDLIDMSTTSEALLDAGAAAVYGASPDVTKAPIPLDPENIGFQVGQRALLEKREVILVSEPRIGTDEERRARASKVLKGLRAVGIEVSGVVPNIGAETSKIIDFKGKLVIAVTDTGGVAYDAAYTEGAPAVITATIARTPFKRGRRPAEDGADRAIKLAKENNCGITVVAASANSLEDILASEYIARLIIEKGFTQLGS